MRITGGRLIGRSVECPPGIIRPAMDRMRESLFSTLGDLEGARVLDLFAGSGIMGLEAASRGAKKIVFVEKDRRKGPVLRQNLAMLDNESRLFLTDVERFLRRKNQECFDLVFLDPPFGFQDKAGLLTRLSGSAACCLGSQVILHYCAAEIKSLSKAFVPCLALESTKKYGGSAVSFYRFETRRLSVSKKRS